MGVVTYMLLSIKLGLATVKLGAQRMFNHDLEHSKQQARLEIMNCITADGSLTFVVPKECCHTTYRDSVNVVSGIKSTPKTQDVSSTLSQEEHLRNKYGLPKMMDNDD